MFAALGCRQNDDAARALAVAMISKAVAVIASGRLRLLGLERAAEGEELLNRRNATNEHSNVRTMLNCEKYAQLILIILKVATIINTCRRCICKILSQYVSGREYRRVSVYVTERRK